MKGFSLVFSKRNYAFLGVCLAGLGLFVAVSILPLIAQIKLIENEIPAIEAKIAEQSDLAILIKTIDKKLSELKEMPELPTIELSSIPLSEVNSVADEIRVLAKQENIKVLKVDPIIPKSGIKLQTVTFTSTIQGKNHDLRSFLFSLLKVPYIDEIEQLQIQSNDRILNMNLTFTVRLS